MTNLEAARLIGVADGQDIAYRLRDLHKGMRRRQTEAEIASQVESIISPVIEATLREHRDLLAQAEHKDEYRRSTLESISKTLETGTGATADSVSVGT